MDWSKLFIPTLREAPAQPASAAHRLLMRAGYLRRLAASGYSWLFLARRSLGKIVQIAREELDAIGGQEIYVPSDHNVADLARELRSPKQFPQIWYQLSSRLDSWSFNSSPESLNESREQHLRAFSRILDRCGLKYIIAGGDIMAPSDAGQDSMLRGTGYEAHMDAAISRPEPPRAADPEGDLTPEAFHTPDCKTIAEIARFTGLPETSQIKSLVIIADGAPVLALVRGDHQLNEVKLARVLDATDLRPANAQEIKASFGAEAGSLGPVAMSNLRMLADEALRGRRNMIAGANRNDYHLRNVTPGEDFAAEFFDIRRAAEGETSVVDGGPLTVEKVIRLASLAKNTYWIALEQILIAAVDQNRDQDGIILPPSIAPFTVVITPVSPADADQRRAAEEIYSAAQAAGIDTVLDDRDERAGVKFKDADLTGIPYRITVGKKLTQGMVEVVARSPKQSTDVAIGEAAAFIAANIRH